MLQPDLKGRSAQFISFEGIDGAGKTTHLEHAVALLRAQGRSVVLTREPGGTDLAETLRELVLNQDMDGLTEALLVFAARRDHLRQVIVPALKRGDTVVCDRFTDATFAYQGAGRGGDWPMLEQLEAWVQQGLQPDVTFLFDLPPEQAAQRRAASRGVADRFEVQDTAFFERVRSGYQRRRAENPDRFVLLDSSCEAARVWEQIQSAGTERRLW
jgi:dTMP kinase